MKSISRGPLKRIAKALATLALACILAPTAALGEPANGPTPEVLPNGEVRVNGTIPVDKQAYQTTEDATELYALSSDPLPARYSSRDQTWARGIKVKDQAKTGLCWAFATTSAAEYSYAKETYSRIGTVYESSPAHLGYFFYNRVNDPLGNTAGDYNQMNDLSEGWPMCGGSEIYAMQHLATYSGLGLESKTPMSLVNQHVYHDDSTNTDVWDGTNSLFDNSLAYDDYATIQESIYYHPTYADFDTAVSTVKRMVYDYGAVSASVEFDVYRFQEERYYQGQPFYSGYSHYNFKEVPEINHAVTIVGWDDNYPASNFTHSTNVYGNALSYTENGITTVLSESEARGKTTPPGNGAWIVQNSWGTTDYHDGGFYYLSYYSADGNVNGNFVAYDMQDADTYRFNFQYDGTAGCDDASEPGNENYLTVQGTRAANVYANTTAAPISLEAVGYTTYNAGLTNYDISVYTALADPSNPTSGILAGTTHASSSCPGVKTAVLDKPVTIGAGETYSIVFSFPDKLACFGVERGGGGIYLNVAQTNPGQSFFCGADSYTWEDMDQYDACFRIKGLANAVSTANASFTVRFVDGMGKTISTQTVRYGRAAQVPTAPTRDGYIFDGWDVGFSYVTSNLIVTAIWEIDPFVPVEWKRLAGAGRYETMASIVETGFDWSDWVVVATGANFPDALVASSLAGLHACPVVLTKGTSEQLGKAARQTIDRLSPNLAYVVGGTSVISQGIENELKSMGIKVTRIAGSNRQATSVAALEELSSSTPDTVVIATGYGFADALSIGPWCYKHSIPILLAKNGKLSTSQVKAVQSMPSITKVVIVGGTAAVSDDVKTQLGWNYEYERLEGENRYETSAAIAEWELEERTMTYGGGWDIVIPGMTLTNVAIATGKDYPDALAGAALCGRNDSVLLLVAPGEKNIAPAEGFLYNHPNEVSLGYVLGGTSAVPESIVDRIRDASL